MSKCYNSMALANIRVKVVLTKIIILLIFSSSAMNKWQEHEDTVPKITIFVIIAKNDPFD